MDSWQWTMPAQGQGGIRHKSLKLAGPKILSTMFSRSSFLLKPWVCEQLLRSCPFFWSPSQDPQNKSHEQFPLVFLDTHELILNPLSVLDKVGKFELSYYVVSRLTPGKYHLVTSTIVVKILRTAIAPC